MAPNTPTVPVLGWGTGEALFAATLSGSPLGGNTDVQECGDQADIQWGGKEDGRA